MLDVCASRDICSLALAMFVRFAHDVCPAGDKLRRQYPGVVIASRVFCGAAISGGGLPSQRRMSKMRNAHFFSEILLEM
ncbi:MAG: hypothetical protein KDI38_06810 [Calditrichaeota bacterium]|nr:hypothetical protein [Calditrichota bacterium]